MVGSAKQLIPATCTLRPRERQGAAFAPCEAALPIDRELRVAEHENCIGETSEWYTPASIFDALRLTFDLDPAHPGAGAKHCHVPAKKIYTTRDNGLKQPWRGLVWMNPPFGGRNGHVPWMRKFFKHANGVMLVRSYTSSAWWHAEMHKAQMILFPKGKTKFVRPDGTIGIAPGHGVVLVGMGEVACEALLNSRLGMCWDRRDELCEAAE
jgi:DNA N-6-adenine-methyltransferase Dam